MIWMIDLLPAFGERWSFRRRSYRLRTKTGETIVQGRVGLFTLLNRLKHNYLEVTWWLPIDGPLVTLSTCYDDDYRCESLHTSGEIGPSTVAAVCNSSGEATKPSIVGNGTYRLRD
jgi:hypothetical protein